MNDNEKAASFIGWRECPNPEHNWIYSCDSHLFHCYGCGREDSIFARIHLPAPDMNKPENYMRALEASGRQFAVERKYPATRDKGLAYACEITTNGHDAFACWYQTAAQAVVKALASLYDAEHKENV